MTPASAASVLPACSAAPSVDIWQVSDPETEVRLIAQAIRELVLRSGKRREGGLRYRNIGVIAPDLEGYRRRPAAHFLRSTIFRTLSTRAAPLGITLWSNCSQRSGHCRQSVGPR